MQTISCTFYKKIGTLSKYGQDAEFCARYADAYACSMAVRSRSETAPSKMRPAWP